MITILYQPLPGSNSCTHSRYGGSPPVWQFQPAMLLDNMHMRLPASSTHSFLNLTWFGEPGTKPDLWDGGAGVKFQSLDCR